MGIKTILPKKVRFNRNMRTIETTGMQENSYVYTDKTGNEILAIPFLIDIDKSLSRNLKYQIDILDTQSQQYDPKLLSDKSIELQDNLRQAISVGITLNDKSDKKNLLISRINTTNKFVNLLNVDGNKLTNKNNQTNKIKLNKKIL